MQQVGVSFDLYYDARKHKIKISNRAVVNNQLDAQFVFLYLFIPTGINRYKKKNCASSLFVTKTVIRCTVSKTQTSNRVFAPFYKNRCAIPSVTEVRIYER